MPETDGIKDRKANRRELGDRSDSHVYRGMFMASPFQRARLSGIRGKHGWRLLGDRRHYEFKRGHVE